MADTRKNLLQQQIDALGGLTDAAMSPGKIAAMAYKAAVPVNARQFLKGISGDTSGVSEDDLWASDKEALKAAVAHAMTPRTTPSGMEKDNNTPDAGVFDYGDYNTKSGAFNVGNDSIHAGRDKRLWDIIKSSYTDPAFRMATTVGGAVYGKNPDGTVSVKDKYDFDYPKSMGFDLKFLIRELMHGTPPDVVLEQAGNTFIGDASSGYKAQPYKLNIGKIKAPAISSRNK
jgi:hypothetical protein